MTEPSQTPAPAHDPKKDKLIAGCVTGGIALVAYVLSGGDETNEMFKK